MSLATIRLLSLVIPSGCEICDGSTRWLFSPAILDSVVHRVMVLHNRSPRTDRLSREWRDGLRSRGIHNPQSEGRLLPGRCQRCSCRREATKRAASLVGRCLAGSPHLRAAIQRIFDLAIRASQRYAAVGDDWLFLSQEPGQRRAWRMKTGVSEGRRSATVVHSLMNRLRQ